MKIGLIEQLEYRIVLSGFPFAVGSSGIDYGTGIGTDRAGNIYVAGTFQGKKVDFNPGPGTSYLASEGEGSAFVAKYDSNGRFKWAEKVGSQLKSIASAPVGVSGRIAVDGDGNVYTTGVFSSGTGGDFGIPDLSFGSIYVVKLNTNGKTVWRRGIGGFGIDVGFGLALDNDQDLFVTGTYSAGVNFNAGGKSHRLSSQGLLDAFVAKFTTSGNVLWARGIGGSGLDAGFGIAASPKNGQVYVTGTTTSGSVSFYDESGNSTKLFSQSGDSGAFVIKLTAGGHLGFAKVLAGGSKTFAEGFSVAVDPGNDIFVGGAFSGTVDFDPASRHVNLTPIQATDGFLTKLSGGAGNFLITKRIGGPDDNSVNDVKITSRGDVYVAGFYNAPHVTVSGSGSAGLGSQGGAGMFVGKFRISGGFQKARGYGGGLDDWATAITVDENHDDIYFTGFVDAVTGNEKSFQFVNITKGATRRCSGSSRRWRRAGRRENMKT